MLYSNEHDDLLYDPANVAATLAKLYSKVDEEPSVSSSGFCNWVFKEMDTTTNTTRQNIEGTLAREPGRNAWYFTGRASKSIASANNEEIDQSLLLRFIFRHDNIKIEYRNQDIVLAFLAQHPKINELLRDSWSDLVDIFGKSVSIALELMAHTENEYYEELIGWIQCHDSIDEGLDKFDLFLDKWLDRQLEMAGDKFNFNIEFK